MVEEEKPEEEEKKDEEAEKEEKEGEEGAEEDGVNKEDTEVQLFVILRNCLRWNNVLFIVSGFGIIICYY